MVDPSGLFTVRFAVRFGFAAAVVVFAATAAFHFGGEGSKTTLVFFAAACAAVGQLGAALYTARILHHTVANSRPDEDLAARFGERWTDASMFHIRNECRNLVDDRREPDKILAELKKDRAKATNAGNILNFLEELAISIERRRCSEPMAKSLFCGIVINTWHATEPWVREQRVERGRPQLWSKLETLYGVWRNQAIGVPP